MNSSISMLDAMWNTIKRSRIQQIRRMHLHMRLMCICMCVWIWIWK